MGADLGRKTGGALCSCQGWGLLQASPLPFFKMNQDSGLTLTVQHFSPRRIYNDISDQKHPGLLAGGEKSLFLSILLLPHSL